MEIAVLAGAELKPSVGIYTYNGNPSSIFIALMQNRKRKMMTMEKRDFTDMVIFSCQKVSEMNISRKCKMELIGMITAIEMKHDELIPKWIPVTERLPEEREWLGTKRFGTTISDEVYVTFENPKGERFCKHLSFQNGKLSRFDQSTIDAFYPEAKPIAWMPLPEPAKIGDGK